MCSSRPPGSLAAVIDNSQPNPDVDGLDVLYRDFWKHPDSGEVIVAVGGGSALDTAKALMVGTESGEFDALVALLATGKPFVPQRVRSLIAVPTTSGTGSEVTGWATVWHRAAGKKYSLHLPETWPQAAVVDPELVLSLPTRADARRRPRRPLPRARVDLERQRQPGLGSSRGHARATCSRRCRG